MRLNRLSLALLGLILISLLLGLGKGSRLFVLLAGATAKPGWFLFTGFVKTDLQTRTSTEFHLPEGVYASEAPFAPRVGAVDEDDGYLVSIVFGAELHVQQYQE